MIEQLKRKQIQNNYLMFHHYVILTILFKIHSKLEKIKSFINYELLSTK